MIEDASKTAQGASGDGGLADGLTGLPNRRALDRRLEELSGAEGRFGLLFVELDGLAELNAARGREMGDRALMEFARMLSEGLRADDSVFRYGGDQFVVLSPGLEPGNEVGPGRRILSRTEALLPKDWGVSAGIGQALYPTDSSSVSDLLSLAAMAARSAKESGGSRVLRWREGRDLFWHRNVFTDRQRELAELHSRLYPGRDCALVLLAGEAGMGKTSLLQTALQRLPGDINVIRLSSSRELSRVPYAAALAAVRRTALRLGVPEVGPVVSTVLSGLLPDVFEKVRTTGMPPLERVVLLDALCAVLRKWTPAVLVADDGRWLDEGTVSLLSYALSHGGLTDLSVCCGLRAESLHFRQPPPAADLAAHPLAARMSLEPMDGNALGALAKARLGGESVDSALLDELLDVSGGNPLLATEHLRSLAAAGCIRPDEELSLTLTGAKRPRPSVRIRTFVRNRLEQLEEDNLRMLALAATLGRRFEVGDVASLVALGEGQVLSCFDRAERLGLLRACNDPLRFELSASYLREGLLERISDGLRATFHSAVADMYRAAGDRAMAAVHLESAGRHDEAMEERLSAAAELESSGLIHMASGHLAAAVRLMERLAEDGGDTERLAEVALHAAEVHMKAGMHRRARGLALKAAAAGDGEVRAAALLTAAQSLRVLDDSRRALVELRRISPPTQSTAVALGLEKADVLTRIGRPKRAEAELDGLRGLLSGADRYRALHKHSLIHLCNLRMNKALKTSREALRAAEAGENTEALWWLWHDYAELCLYCGHVTEAGKAASRALSAAEDVLSLWGSIWSLIMISRTHLRALRPAGALESVERAERLAERTDDPETMAGAQLVAALALSVCGRTGEAAAKLHSASCWGVIDPLVLTYARVRRGLLAGSSGTSEEGRLALAALESRRSPLELVPSSLVCNHDIRLLACEAILEEDPEDALGTLRGMDLEEYPRGRLWRARLEASALKARGEEESAGNALRSVLADGRTRTETLERLMLYRSAGELLPEGAERLRRLSRRLRSECGGTAEREVDGAE